MVACGSIVCLARETSAARANTASRSISAASSAFLRRAGLLLVSARWASSVSRAQAGSAAAAASQAAFRQIAMPAPVPSAKTAAPVQTAAAHARTR